MEEQQAANQHPAVDNVVACILDTVARRAPLALAGVAAATAVVTTMAPEQAAAALPAWLFAAGSGVGVNLLSDWLGELARGRRDGRQVDDDDEAIMARLAQIFPLDQLAQSAAGNRAALAQLTRMAAWQRQIKAVVDRDYELGLQLAQQVVALGADVAAMSETLAYLIDHAARPADVAAATDSAAGRVIDHADARFDRIEALLAAAPARDGQAADALTYTFLQPDERRQLTAILAALPLLLTGGAAGRLTFLLGSGLGRTAGRLALHGAAEPFAGALVALAESADRLLDDPPGVHPLAAVCAAALDQPDMPRGDRPFPARLMLKYALVEDAARADALRDEFGPPDAVTPWREARRPVAPAGPRFYTHPTATLNTLPYDLRASIRNFLADYLGSPDRPVPFGGRAGDLRRLESWRESAGEQRLLLAAPGGTGKSALLARWADALSRPPSDAATAVVFVPISSRYGTNRDDLVLPAIAVQLAQLLGEELPANWGNMAPGFWQNLIGRYLQRPLPDGRRLLLIVDGLDEAAWEIGPGLFPHELPPTTRVVVSARYLAADEAGPAAWLARLGWERPGMAAAVSLQTLTRAGVGEAVAGMGQPLNGLAGRERVIDRLYALTGGDPLLVGLYVVELAGRGDDAAQLRPEELDDIEPGYEGYFDRWWKEQKKLWAAQGQDDPLLQETLTRSLLRVLSVALGPLSFDDVAALLQQAGQSPIPTNCGMHSSRCAASSSATAASRASPSPIPGWATTSARAPASSTSGSWPSSGRPTPVGRGRRRPTGARRGRKARRCRPICCNTAFGTWRWPPRRRRRISKWCCRGSGCGSGGG